MLVLLANRCSPKTFYSLTFVFPHFANVSSFLTLPWAAEKQLFLSIGVHTVKITGNATKTLNSARPSAEGGQNFRSCYIELNLLTNSQ